MAGPAESAAVQLTRAMSAKKKVSVRSLNPYIVCKLCVGYIVDATTIVECLHSFCRACIIKYFETNRFCPICDVQVNKTKPLLSLRSDTTLQSLIYKIVPSLYQREMNRRKEFLQEHPSSGPISGDEDTSGLPLPVFFSPDDTISLSLEYLDNDDSESLVNNVSKEKQMIHKRYLQCPAAVTMRHLKKFVRMKYGLGNEFQVDIIYESENLADDFSLMDVAYTFKWHRTTPMRFSYRISERPPPLLLGPQPPPSSEPVQAESPPPEPPLPPPPPPPPPPQARAPRPPTRSTSGFTGDDGHRRRQQRRQQRQRSAKTAAYSALEAMEESATDVEDRDDEDYDEIEDPEPVFKKARRSSQVCRQFAAPGARTPRPSVVDSETRYGRSPGGKVPVYMMGQSSKAFQVKNCQVTVVDVQKHAQHIPTSPQATGTSRPRDVDEYDFEAPHVEAESHLDDEDFEQQAEAMIEEVIEDEEDERESEAAAEEAVRAAAAAAAAAVEVAAEAAAAAKRSSSVRKRKKAKHHHHHHHHKHRDKDKKRCMSELTPTLIPSPDSEMKLTLKLRPCKTPDNPQPNSPADSTTTPPTPASAASSRLSSASSESPEPVSSSTGKVESSSASTMVEESFALPPPAVSPPAKIERVSKDEVMQIRIVRKTAGPLTPSPSAGVTSPSPPAMPALKTPASLTVSKISAGGTHPSGQTPPPTSASRPSLEILLLPASPPVSEVEPEPDTTAPPEPRADAVGALDLSGKSTRTTTATTSTPTSSAVAILQRPNKTNTAAMRNLMTLSNTAVHVQSLMATQESALYPSSRTAARPPRPLQTASTPHTATLAAIPPPSVMTRPGPNQTVRHIPNPSALLQRNNHLLLQAQALAARDINERLKTLPASTSISNNNNNKFNGRPGSIIGRMEMARNIEKVAAGLTMRAVEARAGK